MRRGAQKRLTKEMERKVMKYEPKKTMSGDTLVLTNSALESVTVASHIDVDGRRRTYFTVGSLLRACVSDVCVYMTPCSSVCVYVCTVVCERERERERSCLVFGRVN